MRKINEILAVVILSLLAVLLAAIGLRSYDTFITRREQEKILSRNQEANDRVQEMQQEIQVLSQDREKLVQFLEEIQTGSASTEEAVPAAAMFDEERESWSENTTVSGNGSWSENTTVSGNGSWSENTTVSGNGSWSGNTTVSGNGSWSENTTVSGNGSWSENTTVSGNGSWSENTTVSGNTTVSDNSTISGNTLEERRLIRSSLEETLLVNQEDRLYLEQSPPDFSGKKIACLGDSITAAANLEEQENYPDCSYPSILKELLGAEEVYNLGIGGSSIGRYWADAFVERYEEIPPDTDIILVMGGTNDGFCLSEKELGTLEERKPWTLCGDLDELMQGLRENYPDAEIYFITPLPNILQDYLMRERDYLLPQRRLVNVMLELSEEYGFTVIDLYNSNILDSHDVDIVTDYMPDGVHPNEDGYQILAEHIAAELARNSFLNISL
ncbi:MAG: hypothetical protein HDR05_00090 [Lachnospiraceae bacterium]|nr:hypothetical protein [Lachnospiraceae bacterium]